MFELCRCKLTDMTVDCSFILTSFSSKEQRSVKCHKNLLAERSPVFDTMFFGSLPETGPVTITDASYEAFMDVIDFIYYSEVELCSIERILKAYRVAHKYQVDSLQTKYIDYLSSRDDWQLIEVFQILETSSLLNDEPLWNSCTKILETRFKELITSTLFTKTDISTATTIIEQQNVCNVTEIEVFEACLKWAQLRVKRREGNLRTAFKPFLSQIDFRLLKDNDEVLNSGVLSEEEIAALKDDAPIEWLVRNNQQRSQQKLLNCELLLKSPIMLAENGHVAKMKKLVTRRGTCIANVYGVRLIGQIAPYTGIIILADEEVTMQVVPFGSTHPDDIDVFFTKPLILEPDDKEFSITVYYHNLKMIQGHCSNDEDFKSRHTSVASVYFKNVPTLKFS